MGQRRLHADHLLLTLPALSEVESHDGSNLEYVVQWQRAPRVCLLPAGVACAAFALLAAALWIWSLPMMTLLACALCALTAHWYLFHVASERLVVLRGLGIVLESRAWCGLRLQSQFVDFRQLASLFINEGLTTSDVRYYLAMELHGRREMAVAFPHLLPRLALLQPVYAELLSMAEWEKQQRQGRG
jgi:hypothetical protein